MRGASYGACFQNIRVCTEGVILENPKSTAGITDIKSFQNLAPESRVTPARGLRYVNYKKSAPVLHRGQQVSGAYIVISGQLRGFALSPDRNEATLYLINPGETCVLALNCIFSNLPYPAWVEATAATRVAVIPGAKFRVLFESESEILNMTVQAFSTIVFRLMMELEELHASKLDRRLSRFLLLQAASDGRVHMTQQEIASHRGTTRELIARALCQLASAGHLRTSRNLIVIHDPPKLAEAVVGSGKRSMNHGVQLVAPARAERKAAPDNRFHGIARG